jgi:hypothetical protein
MAGGHAAPRPKRKRPSLGGLQATGADSSVRSRGRCVSANVDSPGLINGGSSREAGPPGFLSSPHEHADRRRRRHPDPSRAENVQLVGQGLSPINFLSRRTSASRRGTSWRACAMKSWSAEDAPDSSMSLPRRPDVPVIIKLLPLVWSRPSIIERHGPLDARSHRNSISASAVGVSGFSSLIERSDS